MAVSTGAVLSVKAKYNCLVTMVSHGAMVSLNKATTETESLAVHVESFSHFPSEQQGSFDEVEAIATHKLIAIPTVKTNFFIIQLN